MKVYPLVSVIIPNYNHANYLDQRIQSVLNQTYKNFEIIILDDKSTDNSMEVIKKYRDNAFVSHIVLNIENSGSTFKQWQKGFGLAKGELIWIAESDDYCDSSFLQELVSAIEKHPSAVVAYSDIVCVDSEGRIIENQRDNYHTRSGNDGFYIGRDYIKRFCITISPLWNASSALFRKGTAMQLDPIYCNFRSAGDYMFWVEMLEKGDIVKVRKPLDFFRRHNSSVTMPSMKSGLTHRETYRIYKYMVNHGLKTGISRFRSYVRNTEIAKYSEMFDSNVRNELSALWDPYGLMTPHVFAICWRLLKYFDKWNLV